MTFADYAFYQTTYCGTLIRAEQWDKYAAIATAHINHITQSRLTRGAPLTDAARLATCAAADVFARYDAMVTGLPLGIKSENTDGYSVSYQDGDALLAERTQQLRAAVDSYLPPCDPLRYRGV